MRRTSAKRKSETPAEEDHYTLYFGGIQLPDLEGPLPENMSIFQYETMQYEQILQRQPEKTKEEELQAEEQKRLAVKQKNEAEKREKIQKREMRKYFKNNPLDEKSFVLDIGKYSSLYVFCFGYAKLESPEYQKFMKSLTEDFSSKVYFGFNRSLSRIVGMAPKNKIDKKLKPGDRGYKTEELKRGLHKIGLMLDDDDVGVLLTDKTKEEVLSKFREYRELDFVKPGNTPMEKLDFEKDDVLSLPPRSSAMKLCPKLKELGMPVELSGGLTEKFIVCEDGVRVTENAAKILEHLGRRMFDFVLVPLGCWHSSTGKTEHFDLHLPERQ
ncbi:hypothetical protein MKW98_004621 [Papaver atlanticum]|uniref:Uncharacterized protein n=1 Tax=Papaver atlanticum TaxID=357466 RepID=A0AAD4SRA2_9MAGN|nr:hypothetical protein MKW98_004621 [Papaver atlanticum]